MSASRAGKKASVPRSSGADWNGVRNTWPLEFENWLDISSLAHVGSTSMIHQESGISILQRSAPHLWHVSKEHRPHQQPPQRCPHATFRVHTCHGMRFGERTPS
jgi:hypothetical protein